MWAAIWFVAINTGLWLLLVDEYDGTVRGFQQTNFTMHERVRLAFLLPGLPLVFLFILVMLAPSWRKYGRILSNFKDATLDHLAIIATGSKAGYKAAVSE